MPEPTLNFLSSSEIQAIHNASLRILAETGMVIHHAGVLEKLAAAGVRVDLQKKLARFSQEQVMGALAQAGKRFAFHGRDPARQARFGMGEANLISTPGQYAWFDHRNSARREPLLQDAVDAARVGDALSNVTIVGAMAVPTDIPQAIRDVLLSAALVRATGKPTRCWPVSRQSSRYVLEIYALLAGGKAALRQAPMLDTFLEPISPLQLPETGLDIMLEFLEYGQPISIGPMAMTSGTAPATLAGTLAQENAEILGGLATVQTLAPGTPIIYGGIPHIMDPRTSICAFGAPEQGLMAAAMTQLGKFYGLPVYVNVNLTDSKVLDAQAGMEKMGGFMLGMLSGADLFGHGGIVGTDHGGSLPWLVVDDEIYNYARRVMRGFTVNEDNLALPVIDETGPGGNYLAHEHTVSHFRKELWLPGAMWMRETFDVWSEMGKSDVAQRATARVEQILATQVAPPLDPRLDKEIEAIVAAARRELLGQGVG